MTSSTEDTDAQMQTVAAPDTPPATGTQPSFFSSTSGATSQPAPQPSQPSHYSAHLDHHRGMETPPPSAMHFSAGAQLLTPGPTSTPPAAREVLGPTQPDRKMLAEIWSQAGWGGKKGLEEYELQKDKLLDKDFSLAHLGDDYDESAMW
ncbi:hypothetical protein BDZ91DRAFT_845020 [Kalaharituber pfeilii]|nr:hypothetical protein BDZ91DRAFT_845020 [Kalaharituber pfeilii]